jgi:diadenosine tetraphosphate (Ap4A) HIT family hydrolase
MDHKIESCPFCNKKEEEKIFINELSFAVKDNFPVSRGHTLIISKRHTPDYFKLTAEERRDCWDLVQQVKEYLNNNYSPDGYNIGINVNEAAGQSVGHVHIHIIPRYKDDVSNPRGGIRNVIPGKGDY